MSSIWIVVSFVGGVLFGVLIILPRAVKRYHDAVQEAVGWETVARGYQRRIKKMLDPSLPPDMDEEGPNE